MAASEVAPRVALLARAGDACERIAGALREAGAEVVLVADPMQADPAQVRQAQPQAVLVALEPAIEDAIERFEDVLADPGYMVIFEEAEQAAQRSGWDAARWLRHLSAKLHRHNDVLPAGAEVVDDLQLTAEPMPAQPVRVDFDDAIVALTDEAQDHAGDVPQDGLEGLAAADATPEWTLDTVADPDAGAATGSAGSGEGDAGFAHAAASVGDDAGLEPDAPLEWTPVGEVQADDVATQTSDALDVLDFESLTLSIDEGDATDPDGLSFDPERFSRAGQAEDAPGGIEEFLAAQAAGARIPAEGVEDSTDNAVDAEVAEADADAGPAAPQDSAPAPDRFDFSSLSLVEDDHVPVAPVAADKPARTFDLETLGAGLSLLDADSYGNGKPPGLVLIEAGLGGPDAVRQLLAALPAGFPKAILIRLPLEGGRYDRLVKQMTRATSAPVGVADAGERATEGSIHFVPPGLGIRQAGPGWAFEAGQPLEPALLPADDSAVVFLSGADAALVPAVTGGAWAGLVLGQTPDEGCYDPAAARAAIEAGAAHGSPAELAARLLACWPASGERPSTDPNGMP
ncbi:chemotaxis protein CheB [uncultured Luteimonas sp.]|uniref:chemotaxis protein CheB n=1 Tax=uncultured Luteimonas sp. TaxID=453144 RepID=UPI002617FE52|nr:chemotaxis protein CheB [uncultured Luteimonas sp.]